MPPQTPAFRLARLDTQKPGSTIQVFFIAKAFIVVGFQGPL